MIREDTFTISDVLTYYARIFSFYPHKPPSGIKKNTITILKTKINCKKYKENKQAQNEDIRYCQVYKSFRIVLLFIETNTIYFVS